MIAWTVYSRAECSLCDQLIEQLATILGPAASNVAVVDIGDDPGLEAKYGKRIPVLLADGEFVCNFRLDEARVRACMDADG
ncbi:MAG TPA: glutaredoxin family protein [Povalibacter sp.]|jgi:hypothetical protein|nr:glutaredoxin family protein [Povalibacter sp.]